MLRIALIMAALLAVLAPSSARAEFYKWVDRDGREFITNEREKIPAEYRATAKPVEAREDRVSVGQAPAAGASKPARSVEHKDKHGRGEQYWRKRAENLRRQIRDQQVELDLLAKQDREDEADPSLSASSKKKARSARYKKKEKIDRKTAKLRRELEVDLPEEARKADAYPGWLRE